MSSEDPSGSAPAALEVDPDFGTDSENSGFSDYESGFESDTTSLITAAKNHIFENGRRYHGYKEGKYLLPNDEAEQDRMDLIHHCCLLALHGELFIAPVGKNWSPERILDVGTGSGIWAIDMADQYPSAEVIGVDLSPIQPHWVPPNVKFEVDDIEETWQYRDNSFDFIHIRYMAGFVYDWPKLYQQAYKALKPGGWIELQDFGETFACDDGTLPATSALCAWMTNWEKAASMSGKEWQSVPPNFEKALKDLGCVDVHEYLIKLPVGTWPKSKSDKELGVYWRQQMFDAAEGVSMAMFTRVLGWEKKNVDEFLREVVKDLGNPKYHTYTKFYCTYGKKPNV